MEIIEQYDKLQSSYNIIAFIIADVVRNPLIRKATILIPTNRAAITYPFRMNNNE